MRKTEDWITFKIYRCGFQDLQLENVIVSAAAAGTEPWSAAGVHRVSCWAANAPRPQRSPRIGPRPVLRPCPQLQ